MPYLKWYVKCLHFWGEKWWFNFKLYLIIFIAKIYSFIISYLYTVYSGHLHSILYYFPSLTLPQNTSFSNSIFWDQRRHTQKGAVFYLRLLDTECGTNHQQYISLLLSTCILNISSSLQKHDSCQKLHCSKVWWILLPFRAQCYEGLTLLH